MSVHIGKIELQSLDHMPHFHNVTDEVKRIVAESGIKNGLITVYSHHTTCSVITQESSHDLNFFGREFMQMDLIDIMEKLIPSCGSVGQYHHPGPDHIEFALTFPDEEPKYSLNTDAHLRSCFFGRSENIVLENGVPSLGDFGFVYFIDWDQLRERKRVCEVLIMGE